MTWADATGGPQGRASAHLPIFEIRAAYLSAEDHDQQDRDDDEHAEQAVCGRRLPLVLPEPRLGAVARVAALGRLADPVVVVAHLICLPEIARATTSRWISEVP